jgi:hypothetical protein
MKIKVGFFGSCQLHLCSSFFLNEDVLKSNGMEIIFSEPFYEYDFKYNNDPRKINYELFDKIDILIVENNNLDNDASSRKLIEYCKLKNKKIFKTCLLKFPIYPINWSGYGENIKDYIDFNGLENINYVNKFNKCIISLENNIKETDLSIEIVNFIKNNFSEKLLFTHSLHPTNVLLYELWKQILFFLNIDISKYNYNMNTNIINCWYNPFTTKMVKDLNIKFNYIIDDNFYIQRYNEYKNKLIENNNGLWK